MAHAHRTSMGLDSRKMAFWAFIGSECLLFGSLISTYLVYKGRSLVGPYPHEVLNIPFTSFSTFDLLMSSLAMVLALAAVQRVRAHERAAKMTLGALGAHPNNGSLVHRGILHETGAYPKARLGARRCAACRAVKGTTAQQ